MATAAAAARVCRHQSRRPLLVSARHCGLPSLPVAGFSTTSGGFRGTCPPDAGFGTKCLYAGQEPDPVSGARTCPITMSTGFVFKDSADAAAKFALQAFGPIYTRITNPTAEAVERKIAALEGGSAALAVSCGHAAQMLAFSNIMQPGDNFVSTNKLYGGSVTQFGRQFKQFGWECRFVNVNDWAAVEASIDDKTK